MSDQSKPKWREEETVRRGADALRLAEIHRSELEQRLAAGAIDGLRSDLAMLSASKSDRKASKIEQKGRTGKKRDAAEDGKDWVMTVRSMAQRTENVSNGTLTSLGVGARVASGSAEAVKAALEACLRELESNSVLSRSIGLVAQDIDDGKAMLSQLRAAGADQSEVIGRNKDKTFDRNAVQMRIEAAVDMIASRGQMAFRTVRDIRDRFEALVSGKALAAAVTEETEVDEIAADTAS